MSVLRRTVGRWLRSFLLAATTWLLAAAQPALAADPPGVQPAVQPAVQPQAGRPRIALVLGGGGAKGAAHIGIIKVLEEMRVPVDCIAGTSMGALVGAAYATGISAEQLEQIITSVDWKEILSSAPREEIPLQRKRKDWLFPLGLELGVKDGGLTAPAGLVPTHQIEAMFRRIVASAGQVSSFDRLPIPFRAVATDLESGAMVVFDRGDLALAMRASMAVPGAFAPVDYNNRLHVDGMLVRNLPVDVARKLCGDVVIAVPVGNPAATRASLTNLAGIAGQAMNIAIEANEKAQLATLTPKDIAIPVILNDVSSADFAKVPQAIPIGEAAARSLVAELSRYSLTPAQYAEWRAHLRQLASAPADRKIDEIQMSGFNTTNPEVMRSFLRASPGDAFDPDVADADATRLVARGDFSSVSYNFTDRDGRNVLTYGAVEKPWGPNYLLFDLNLSTDMKGDTLWGIRADYEKRWLNSLGGEFRSSVQLGRPNMLGAEFYQPLEPTQRYFAAASAVGWQTISYLFEGDKRAAELDARRYWLALEGGAALDSWGEFRAGLVRGISDIRTLVGSDDYPSPGRNALGGATMRLSFDTLDKRLFPTKGSYGFVSAYLSNTGLGADQTYRAVAFNLMKVVNLRRNVWSFTARGGSDLGTDAPYYDQFKTGGMFNFSGYRPGQLVGREYLLGTAMFRRRVADLNETLGTGYYVGGTLEAGNVFKRLDGTSVRGPMFGGSLFLGIDSRIGPVYLAYGLSEGGQRAIYLYIGSSIEAF